MGKPLNKRFFGVGNLKVQFNDGSQSIFGYIKKQTGSKRFVVTTNGTDSYICTLVDKNSSDLNPGEMSITVQTDDSNVYHVTKISAHKVTINGQSVPWNFDSSTSDGKVQIESDNIDFEGDDEVDHHFDLGRSQIFIGTNSYITFGEGSNDYNPVDASNPGIPKICLGANDNSMQLLYYGTTGTAGNRIFIARYQGSDNTSGDANNPETVIEYWFYEATPNQIDIQIGVYGMSDGYSGITSASAELYSLAPAADTGFRYNGSGVTSIANTLHGTTGLSVYNFQDSEYLGQDDDYIALPIPWNVVFNGVTYNGTGA